MTRDSGHIQESDALYINKKRKRKGQSLVEPLYTVEDAVAAAKHLVPRDYNVAFEPIPGAVTRLVEAGHILGSAGVVLDLDDQGHLLRLMFSGDIGRVDLPIIRDPALPVEVDYLIMECTYGDRSHFPPERAYSVLREIVHHTVTRGGKVIIPAFAVGRTQTLVYYLHRMFDHGDIPGIPIFVDSPLAVSVTDIFRQHPECFDRETQAFMETDPQGTALGFDLLTYTRSVEESKAINELEGPAVIISASGMAETGRILHHLKNNLTDPKNAVLITSWMAPHTLGRRLLEGHEKVKIFGEEYRVRAKVHTLNGLSAHGDQAYLLEYARAVKGRVKKIFLVHGELHSAEVLSDLLKAEGFEVEIPELGQSFEL